MHHSQFLAELIDAGRLPVDNPTKLYRITLHDPCYLARANAIERPAAPSFE